jgi:hypothetical protein
VPRSITRSGRQEALLAAGAPVVADVLSDPVAVTALLGDLVDQRRSDPGPPARWVLPRINLGLRGFDTTLVPTFSRTGHEVVLEAVTTPDSDAGATLRLAMAPSPISDVQCRLTTSWRLLLRVSLPFAAHRLAGPALDRTVASTVQTIMWRTEEAVRTAE